MKFLFVLLCAAVLFSACAKKQSLGTLQVTFTFNQATGDVEPSFQTAVWLEDADSHYVKTLFLSEYLSYGGYNDSTICPAWNSLADWGHAPMKAYDAVTRATPPLGVKFLHFNLDSLALPPGAYLCCVQTHIIEDYNILFKNRIDIGRTGNETTFPAIYAPNAYPGAENILADVKTVILKNEFGR